MATETGHSQGQTLSTETNEERETCRATFNLEGMMCASCATHIEKGWKKVPGVFRMSPKQVYTSDCKPATEPTSHPFQPTSNTLTIR